MEQRKDDPDSLKDLGAEWVSRLCEQPLNTGGSGIHFYTLYQAQPTLRILDKRNL